VIGIATGALVTSDPKSGVVRFIGYDPQAVGFNRASPALQAMPLQSAAEQHMAGHVNFFGLKDTNNSYGGGLYSAAVRIKVRGVDLSAILSLVLD